MELPKRAETMTVRVDGELSAVLRTLTSRELAAIWERSSPEVKETKKDEKTETATVELRTSMAEVVRAFEEHLVAFEGPDVPTFDGKPFEPGNADHISRIPATWKITGGSELLSDAMLVGAVRGNSEAPGGRSLGE